MPGHPDASELLSAVRDFIAGLPLEGRDAFHARVAANVLAIVMRELAAKPDVVEVAALASFASSPRTRGPNVTNASDTSGPRIRGDDGGEVNSQICHAIRDGTLTPATPGLFDALITATAARLAVDNPRYATLARLTAEPASYR